MGRARAAGQGRGMASAGGRRLVRARSNYCSYPSDYMNFISQATLRHQRLKPGPLAIRQVPTSHST
ncbi:hypothetical protein Sros01_78700 [Streptomyces roseochromogenus]|nr:hypothetical protein Sros01_78700 [Streptomyces roseochromogenus]